MFTFWWPILLPDNPFKIEEVLPDRRVLVATAHVLSKKWTTTSVAMYSTDLFCFSIALTLKKLSTWHLKQNLFPGVMLHGSEQQNIGYYIYSINLFCFNIAPITGDIYSMIYTYKDTCFVNFSNIFDFFFNSCFKSIWMIVISLLLNCDDAPFHCTEFSQYILQNLFILVYHIMPAQRTSFYQIGL